MKGSQLTCQSARRCALFIFLHLRAFVLHHELKEITCRTLTECFIQKQNLAKSYMKQSTLVLLVVEAGIPSVGKRLVSLLSWIPLPAHAI